MERADFEWDVSRNGRTVRIDVIRAGSVTSVDTDAVVAATEELISDDGVRLVQFNGPALADQPPPSLAAVSPPCNR